MFFFKQKTAYDMRISDWSSDVCSSDLYLIAVVSNLVYLIVFLTEIRSSLVSRSIKMPCGSAADKEARSDQDRITPGRGKRCPAPPFHPLRSRRRKIGRASCRERVCTHVLIPVVAASFKKKKNTQKT